MLSDESPWSCTYVLNVNFFLQSFWQKIVPCNFVAIFFRWYDLIKKKVCIFSLPFVNDLTFWSIVFLSNSGATGRRENSNSIGKIETISRFAGLFSNWGKTTGQQEGRVQTFCGESLQFRIRIFLLIESGFCTARISSEYMYKKILSK